MEFPFGHHGHHHRRDDDEEEHRYPPPGYQPYPDDRRPAYDAPPPPPPHQYGGNVYGPPDYPPVQHVSHDVGPDRRPAYDAHPPPQYGGNVYGPPSYPPVQHVSHDVGPDRRPAYDAPHPPPPQYGGNVYDPPGYPPVQHVSHVVEPPAPYGGSGEHGYGREEAHHHHHHDRDHRPPFSAAPVEHVGHRSWEGGGSNRQPTVKVFTKAKEDFALTIREGKVVLAPANPRDEFQHWIKDMRYSTKVKDQEGFPSFALVNKVTGEAIKHSMGATHPVRLVPYKPDYLDESVLWTESNNTGEGFRCIRMVNNIGLNFDAFHGDDDHGGVHDGTHVVLWEWLKGKNQRWKIVPY